MELLVANVPVEVMSPHNGVTVYSFAIGPSFLVKVKRNSAGSTPPLFNQLIEAFQKNGTFIGVKTPSEADYAVFYVMNYKNEMEVAEFIRDQVFKIVKE